MVANPEVWWRLIPSCRLRRRGTSSGSLQPGGLLLKALVAQSCRLFITPWTVPTRLLCPWDFPGKNNGLDCHFLFQSIFPTQGSNLCLLHCWLILYTEPPGKPSKPYDHLNKCRKSFDKIQHPFMIKLSRKWTQREPTST